MGSSDDEDSDDYGYGSSKRRQQKNKGRKAKRTAIGSLKSSASLSGLGVPSKLKFKVKTGGDVTGKRSAKGGFLIHSSAGKEANVPPQWQGYADRELDSDTEEPLVFEEAFILRMPIPTTLDEQAELHRFTEMVKKREAMDEKDVWFKFLDSRRAVFNLGKSMYNAKLVDLPCIIESNKTNDNKHMFKTADISQMLLVEHLIPNEQAAISTDTPFKIEDYIYPHGMTPPLRDVRKRRFKPRLNKQAIEIVERQVERLIAQDEDADDVQYEMVDEADILEGEEGRTRAQYEADLAGVDMTLDPATMAESAAIIAARDPANAEAVVRAESSIFSLAPIPEHDVQVEGSAAAVGTSVSAADKAALAELKAAAADASGTDDAGISYDNTAAIGPDESSEADDSDDKDASIGSEDEDDQYDSDLAAMIEGEIGQKAGAAAKGGKLGAANALGKNKAADASEDEAGSSDGDSDDLFGKGNSDDEDVVDVQMGEAGVQDTEETLEAKRRMRLIADEIRDLEGAVNRKKQEVSRAPNPIMRRRFEDSLKKLTSELELKRSQQTAAQSKLVNAQQEIKRQAAEEAGISGAAAGASQTASAAGPATTHPTESAGLRGVQADATSAHGHATAGAPNSGLAQNASAASHSRAANAGTTEDMQMDTPVDARLPSAISRNKATSNPARNNKGKSTHFAEAPAYDEEEDDYDEPVQASVAVPNNITVNDISVGGTDDIAVGDDDQDFDDLFGDDDG